MGIHASSDAVNEGSVKIKEINKQVRRLAGEADENITVKKPNALQDALNQQTKLLAKVADNMKNIPTGGGGSGDSVSWTQILQSGEKIATITINGTDYDVYAPQGGSSGDSVSWSQAVQSGTKIATITIDGTPTDVYVPDTTPSISATATVDGTSSATPTVTVTKSGTDASPSFAFAFSGLKGANGTNGTNGTDGVSPTVTVRSITGGHQIEIVSAGGTERFDVMDGTGDEIYDMRGTEHVIGEYYLANGTKKPLYQRLVKKSDIPITNSRVWVELTAGLTTDMEIVSAEVRYDAYRNNVIEMKGMLPYIDDAGSYYLGGVNFDVTSNQLVALVKSNFYSKFDAYSTIKYTKTTDTPS